MQLFKKKNKTYSDLDIDNKLELIKEDIQSLKNKLFTIQNEPKYKPFDEIYIITHNCGFFIGKAQTHKQVGIVITDAIVRNAHYIYNVKINNEIQIRLESELTHPSDVQKC